MGFGSSIPLRNTTPGYRFMKTRNLVTSLPGRVECHPVYLAVPVGEDEDSRLGSGVGVEDDSTTRVISRAFKVFDASLVNLVKCTGVVPLSYGIVSHI